MNTHPYSSLVGHLSAALKELARLELGPSLAKGRVGEVMLAHELGHTLKVGQGGADGIGPSGEKYEYKVSHDDQFNFNFGHARGDGDAADLVDSHFSGFAGAYCALMTGAEITKIVFCPESTLVPYLRQHLAGVTGKTFQKVFSPIEKFAELEGAVWIRKTSEPNKTAHPTTL